MIEDTEKVCLHVSDHAYAGLVRLAHFYKLSKEEIFGKLVREADLDAADKAFKAGGLTAQKGYYDDPKPWG